MVVFSNSTSSRLGNGRKSNEITDEIQPEGTVSGDGVNPKRVASAKAVAKGGPIVSARPETLLDKDSFRLAFALPDA